MGILEAAPQALAYMPRANRFTVIPTRSPPVDGGFSTIEVELQLITVGCVAALLLFPGKPAPRRAYPVRYGTVAHTWVRIAASATVRMWGSEELVARYTENAIDPQALLASVDQQWPVFRVVLAKAPQGAEVATSRASAPMGSKLGGRHSSFVFLVQIPRASLWLDFSQTSLEQILRRPILRRVARATLVALGGRRRAAHCPKGK